MLRPGNALGDGCWVTRIPRLLSEQYGHDVHVAINDFVHPVFANNPFIKGFVPLPEPHLWHEWEDSCESVINQFDKVYHVHGHVEVEYLYRSDVKWGSIPTAHERKQKAKNKSYQDAIFKAIKLKPDSKLPEFYFTDQEIEDGKKLRKMLNQDKKKLVLWQWDGSSRSKTLVHAPAYLRETLTHNPDAVHYVYTWDENLKAQIPSDPRVFYATGQTDVRQTILLTSIADLVIGPESFLINAAAAFNTPKIVFFSHSAPVNLTKYFENCSNIIPEKSVACHPCYLIHTHFQRIFNPLNRGVAREFERNCIAWKKDYVYESLGYKCCYYLPHNQVRQEIDRWLK